ncbi:MAG: DNA-directed RNA polymerase subunit RPC12/RpoP [Kiritimatiellia bacterium]|jgi:DNA-directed RNA polymerase subunit RPC12/RpoP
MPEIWQPPADYICVDSAVEGISVWAPDPERPEDRQGRSDGYRCPSCGASVGYEVAQGAIACGFCGFQEQVDSKRVGHEAGVKRFTDVAMAAAAATWVLGRKEQHCEACGVDVDIEEGSLAVSCAFCGSAQVLLREGVVHGLRPSAMVPFCVDRDGLQKRARAWLGGGWMHPSQLATGAVMEQFIGVYSPFWTFDARLSCDWSANVGRKKTRRVYRDGKWTSETYIDWNWETGHTDLGQPAHIGPGTSRIHAGLLARVDDFDLSGLVEYHPDFLAGWQAQAFDIALTVAWDEARSQMREQGRAACKRDIGSTHVRQLSASVDFRDEAWRYVLLPLHLCAYSWDGKVYRIVVNGQTGAIAGHKPVVWWRIWLVMSLFYVPGLLLGLIGVPLILLGGLGLIVLVIALLLVIGAVVGSIALHQRAAASEATT